MQHLHMVMQEQQEILEVTGVPMVLVEQRVPQSPDHYIRLFLVIPALDVYKESRDRNRKEFML
jgi:hypothetical protein